MLYVHLFDGSVFYLKCGPVHVHSWSVVVAEPLQILLCVCSQDRALQFSVYCGIAEERKVEQIVTMKVPEGTRRCCQFGIRTSSVVQILCWKRSNIGSWQDWSVSLNFRVKLEFSTEEIFTLFCSRMLVIVLPLFSQTVAMCNGLKGEQSPGSFVPLNTG